MSNKKEEYVVPSDYRFTKDHEWIRIKENKVQIGITDYAAKMLHDIVYVVLPQEGTKLQQKDVLGQVESVKTVADVYMPISGTIGKINLRLAKEPELVSNSPYQDGWMVEVSAENLEKESGDLLDSAAYRKFIKDLEMTES